jgi:hypothetical protein
MCVPTPPSGRLVDSATPGPFGPGWSGGIGTHLGAACSSQTSCAHRQPEVVGESQLSIEATETVKQILPNQAGPPVRFALQIEATCDVSDSASEYFELPQA